MTILTKTMDEVLSGWISSKTLEPYNYWSTSPIQACNTILERASDALQYRLVKNLLKFFFPRYSGIGHEVIQWSHYYWNILRIGDIGLASFLTHLWAIFDETYNSNVLYK
jgi:hypothetical protein